MTKYRITVTYTSGKNAGRAVEYCKNKMESVLHIAEEYLKEGCKVTIEAITVNGIDFTKLVTEAIEELKEN